jgi:hypothetical protein
MISMDTLNDFHWSLEVCPWVYGKVLVGHRQPFTHLNTYGI